MTPLATVVVPTYDHGPTARYALESALEQTVEELEVFVLGDGVPNETRPHIDALEHLDARVTVLHHAKSPRTGEPWRAQALERARGEIVLYLADDDLWLPDHVATLASLLADADFAHALPALVEPDGGLVPLVCDLTLGGFVERMLSGHNWIPFSAAAHTLAAYRRLPVGWETTPMWQKFLRLPGVRLASATSPTVLCFPSPTRRDRSSAERAAELDSWARRVTNDRARELIVDQVRVEIMRSRAELELNALAAADRVTASASELERVAAERDLAAVERDTAVAGRDAAFAERDAAVAERDAAVAEREAVRTLLDATTGTLTWRLRERLLASRVGRTAATVRAARAARRATERSRHAP